MKKIPDLDDWIFTKKISNDQRQVDVSIHLKYPDIKSLIKYSPADRQKKIRQEFKDNFKQFLDTKFCGDYTIIGTRSNPRGIQTKIPYSALQKTARLSFVERININRMSHARKVVRTAIPSFYCVKMTVAIEIEGKEKGFQTIENRFVLIKANSFEQAYKKIEQHKNKYAEPYLNSYGELVRWKIESLDDCYEASMDSIDDLNDPEGVEVYSELKRRKLTTERAWNGKFSS